MKAASYIFQSVAPPVTVFGLPPVLVALLLGICIPLAPGFSLIGVGWLALLGPLTLFVIGCVLLWRLRRKEPHCETVYFLPTNFFKGKKQRVLVVGDPIRKSKAS